MKSFKVFSSICLLALFSLISGRVWGQVSEDFSNLPTNSGSSYLTRSWVGSNGLNWTATSARTDQTINGKAICTNAIGTITSPVVSGGIGILQFSYVRGFTGTNARSIEVWVNNVKQGSTITVDPNSNTIVNYNATLNLVGSVTLELRTSGAQIKIDDISWTSYIVSSPIIISSLSSLSSFSQNSSTPSAEQTYTVSGDNLNGNVSVSPPANYEISLQSGSGFSSNALSLSVSGGNIVNEPVTIYVRQNAASIGAFSGNIVHSSSGATDVNVAVTGLRSGTVYSKATGDLDNLNTWGTNTDGSGTAPSNFSSNGMIYEIRNRSAATISSNWVVSGTGAKVVVGDGTNFTDFTIPSTASFTGSIDVSNAAELTVENSTLPTLNSLATNSTVEYKDIALSIPLNLSYGNLKLTGNGTKAFQGNTTTILGNLTLSNTQLNGQSSSPFSTIDLKGDLTYVGTVTPPADANSITLRTTGTAGGTQTITGAGNTVRWFRITATTANTILLSTTGGSSDLLIGNATSGGIILIAGAILDMNGNDLTFFPGGTTSFSLNTGTISVSSTTDFILNKTNSGSLGTINFTSGSNTMRSLTLNHTGSPANSLTINDPVDLNGNLTISSGELILAANDKLSLTGNLTNNGTLTLENGATIVQGSSSAYSGSGTVQVKQNITGGNNGNSPNGRFWYLGSPVTGGQSSILDAAGANVVKYWDEPSAAWVEITDNTSALTVGRGHYLRSYTPGNQTLTFTGGALNNGTYNIPLTANGASFNGFNLVSNPYPSYLKWDDVAKTNVGTTIWYRTSNGANNMVFDTYNSNGNVGTSNNGAGTVSQFIPPMQAFWVKVEGNTTGSIVLENIDRSHHVSGMQGMHSLLDKQMFANINLIKDTLRDQAIVYSSYTTADVFDAYDSEKMFQANTPQLYSKINEKKVVINAKNFMQRNEKTPLFINIPSAGTYSMQLGEFNSSFGSIWLEDLATAQLQNLLINDTYTFEAEAGQDIARFVLHFGYPEQIFGTDVYETNEDNIDALINWNDVNVVAADDKIIDLTASLNEFDAQQNKTVSVFDMTGRQIMSGSFENGNNQIQVPAANAVYVVQVSVGSAHKVFKVLIQE